MSFARPLCPALVSLAALAPLGAHATEPTPDAAPAPAATADEARCAMPRAPDPDFDLEGIFGEVDGKLEGYYPGLSSHFRAAMLDRYRLVGEAHRSMSGGLRAMGDALESDVDGAALERAQARTRASLGFLQQTVALGTSICLAGTAPDQATSEQRLAGVLTDLGGRGRHALGLEAGVDYTAPGADGPLTLLDPPAVWRALRVALEDGSRDYRRALDGTPAPAARSSAPPAARPPAAPEGAAPPGARDTWYIGFAFGGGLTGVLLDDRTYSYAEHAQRTLGRGDDTDFDFGLDFQAGATLTPKLLLGFEIALMARQGVDSGYHLQHNQYLAALTFFPMDDGKGVYVKGGAGLSILGLTYGTYINALDNAATGFGGAFGIGYAFWLGDSFNLTLSSDLHFGIYGDDPFDGKPEAAWFDLIALGFMWY